MQSTFLGVLFTVMSYLPVLYCKILQNDSLDILGAFTSLIRTVQELNKLSSKSLLQWPTYSSTPKSIATQEDGNKLYQQQLLRNYAEAEHPFSSHYEEYFTSITSCLKYRVEWTDMEFIRDVILFIATQGWHELADEDSQSVEPNETSASYILAIDRLSSKSFRLLLNQQAWLQKLSMSFVICCMRHSIQHQLPSSVVEALSCF